MTIAELIAALQMLPQDVRVVVQGYEGGYADIEAANIAPLRLCLNYNEDIWYYGDHEQANEGEEFDCEAYCIRRITGNPK